MSQRWTFQQPWWPFRTRWERPALASDDLRQTSRRSCEHLLEFVDRALGDDHFLEVHQGHGIGVTRFNDEHVDQVARSQIQVLVHFFGDHQDVVQVHGLEFGSQLLGLGRVHFQGVDHSQTAFAGQLGEDRSHTGAVHLLVDLLGEVFFRAVRENPSAPTPQRRRRHTSTGVACAFLLERLLGGVLDLFTVFLGTGALTRIGLVGHHDLVDQGFVVFTTKHGLGGFHFGSGLTLVIQEFELHQFAPLALTAGRTVTKPPLEPGMAPLIRSRPRASSTRTTSRFWVVTVTSPRWQNIFLPGNTRPGSCAMEMEPGTLCERLLPCEARCEPKLWRLIVPAKPLPMEVPCTSTFWPAANTVTGTAAPAAYWAAVSGVTRNSWMISPASTPALARWPATGLVTRDARRLPNGTCRAT